MSKRLIIILALAFVIGIAFAAYAEVQNVKVSGDLTFLGISRNTSLGSTVTQSAAGVVGGTGPGSQDNQRRTNEFATITRVRIDADLTDNVMTTVRLLNERYWGTESQLTDTTGVNTDIDLDLAYATLKEFLYSPLTLTVGRQELHFGNDMIIGDPDTNAVANAASPFSFQNGNVLNPRDADLSARKSFDAIRATLNYDPLVVDVIYAKIDNSGTQKISNDDTNLYGINANYKVSKKLTAEAYWFTRDRGPKQSNPTAKLEKKRDICNTIGARVVVTPVEDLTAQLEAAHQFGTLVNIASAAAPQVRRDAWALEASLTYNWKKVKYTPTTTLLYSYFSGDNERNINDPLGSSGHAWDPMFENQKSGDIANALFPQSNVALVGGIIAAKPMTDITLKGEYYAYWWNKAFPQGIGGTGATAQQTQAQSLRGDIYTVTQRRFVGQEIDLTATYDYTEDVQFGLMTGWFVPGSTFDKRNSATASEIIGSMKVTF
jgi:hypothetical protein